MSEPATSGPQAATVVLDAIPKPRRIAFEAPWNWLAAGWKDIWDNPALSLTFGILAAIGAGVLLAGLVSIGAQSLFLALAGGFMLVAPVVAVGLYEESRMLAKGHRLRFRDAALAAFGARGQLAFFGMLLLFIFLVWMQLAFLLLMLFLGTSVFPPASAFIPTLLFTKQGLGLLIVGSTIGGLIAAVVFAISALAVPMLLARRIDAISAARASLDAVITNPKPMALWAGLIAALMASAFATILVGLVFVFPLIGHATWHAYAEIFGGED